MRKSYLWLIAFLALALVVVGLFVFREPAAVPQAIRIATLKHESTLPIYFAQQRGLFAAHGVDVQLVDVPPADHMTALISGRVDLLSPTSFPVLFGVMIENPELLYAIFPGAEVSDGPTVYGFVVNRDFAGRDLGSLSGEDKTVMAINPYTRVNIEAILTASGLKREDWPQLRVASREAALQAIASGSATAAIMDQPALAIALASGEYKLLISNPRARYIGSPYWSGAGAVLRSTFDTRSEDVRSVLAAVDEAITAIRSGPLEAHELLAEQLRLDPGIASQMGGYYFPTSSETVEMDAISKTVRALAAAGLLKGQVDFETFFPPAVYGAP